MRASTLAFLLAAPGLVLLAGCGSNDEEDTTPEDVAGSEAADETPVAPEPEPVVLECPASTSIAGVTPSGAAFEAVAAFAGSRGGGVSYTLYLADFDLTLDDFSRSASPAVPTDGTLWTVTVAVFDPSPEDAARISPIRLGSEIDAGEPPGVLTFAVVVEEGGEAIAAGEGATGTLTVTGVGETFCGVIDYADGEASFAGSFAAPAKAI